MKSEHEQTYGQMNESEKLLDRGALETAKSALQVACIQDDQGKYRDAFIYAQIAASTFEEKYGSIADMTIIAKWQ